MIRSGNEISALIAKAARGAGLPLGLAEDLAAAMPMNCGQTDVDASMSALIQHLRDPRSLLKLVAGLDEVQATHGRLSLDLPCDGVVTALIRHRGTIVFDCASDGLVLEVSDQFETQSLKGPFDVHSETLAALDALAKLTYVPATEASRLAGAGAGLTDND